MAKSSSGKPKAPRPRKPKPSATPRPPTDEEIRVRAYEIFLSRGGEPGHELEYWLEAERELRGGA